jgi:hypothetical protein
MYEFLEEVEYDVVTGDDGKLVSKRMRLNADGVYEPYIPNIPEEKKDKLRVKKKDKSDIIQIEGQISIDNILEAQKVALQKEEIRRKLKEEFGDILTEPDENPYKQAMRVKQEQGRVYAL